MPQIISMNYDRPDGQRVLDSFRRWGYLQARLDPLGRLPPQPHPELEAIGPPADFGRRIYCGSIGVEFMHMPFPERCQWVAARLESEAAAPDRRRILERLIEAELFERTLHARYVGTKRFSLEGATALIPLLDEILNTAADGGAEKAVLGMSHRGRLNVMTHILGKRPGDLFAGFEDVDPRSVLGGGDVKYHIGATGHYAARSGKQLHITLVSNPSHLEAVNPVIQGRARAKQERCGEGGCRKVLPISLHGDAAMAGQGITAETLNLAGLEAYSVGGTVRIIINNLIGFTTPPASLQSSRFASDVAKRLPIPIFHVSAEDPDAVVRVGRMAIEYRDAFSSDVIIDLIGYRRHGHSEVDDPTITQPALYRKIQALPDVWESYAKAIGASGEWAAKKIAALRETYDREHAHARGLKAIPVLRQLPEYWDRFRGGRYESALEVPTAAPRERLEEIARRIVAVPAGFSAHPKVKKLLELRLEMGLGKKPVDWGMAEALAFGTLLRDGLLVRLSGEDSRRGTFNHRHAVLFDFETGAEHMPLRHLHPRQGRFECHDSPLSEAAVLGFEFGFSRDWPDGLVLWEAQFGDFVNGAQIILDQFIGAAEDKWGLLSGLVLLLPHGYEGQGPEHSSARIERFLQTAAEHNIQVCQPSTASQYFHLLRRQALRSWRKPLMVLTPKSMLRHPAACSDLGELAQGSFLTVLPDRQVANDASRVLICSGKIGHELREERVKRQELSTAIVLLEQFYPFPEKELEAEIGRHAAARELVWVQEEPANMGGLTFVLPRLRHLARGKPVRSVKRSASASPATGSMKASALEQRTLLALAFKN